MASPEPAEVHNLVCHAHVDMAIMCLRTLQNLSVQPVRLVLHDDGSLTDDDALRLAAGLGGCRVIRRKEADEFVREKLRAYPGCEAFRVATAMAIKLWDVYFYSNSDYGFCDSDVMFLRPFNALYAFPNASVSAMFMHDIQDAYSIPPWRLIGPKALRMPRALNCGLFYIRREKFDLDYFEWIFRKKPLGFPFFWHEQTIWALWAGRLETRFWKASQIMMGKRRDLITDATVGVHFVSNQRQSLPQYAKQAADNATLPPVDVAVGEHREYSSAISVAKVQARVWLSLTKRRIRNRVAPASSRPAEVGR